MKKKIWLTSLVKTPGAVQSIMASLKKYGLEVDGHFFEDDLEKMAWCGPRKELLDQAVNMWIIHGTAAALGQSSLRYGLSLLALTIQAVKGLDFPIVILQEGASLIEADTLPMPFADAAVLPVSGSSYGAKIVAALHKPSGKVFPPYRLDVYGIPQLGQWFEVGPREGEWQGVILGTDEVSITMQAVGPAGRLPERTTLNYAQQGLKIKLGEREYDAWAVQNKIDAETSYYAKVDGHPGSIMFCPYSQEDEAEAYIVTLK